MKHLSYVFLLFAVFLLQGLSFAVDSQSKLGALKPSNLLNPNVSAIAWFQAETGHIQDPVVREESDPFALKEVELAFQAVVDAYAQAAIFVALEDGEAEVEEGYLIWTRLPLQSAIKVGKFLTNFGKFNRIHAPETAFATKPFVHEMYFGEEGLGGEGGSLNIHIPNPTFFTELDLEVINTPEGDEVPGFAKAERRNVTGVARLGSFVDASEASNVSFGMNYALGPAGQQFKAPFNSSVTLTSQFYGLDFIFRWKNPRRAVYRSFLWHTEVFWNDREILTSRSNHSVGLFSHIEYQFARRWRAGGRVDYAESPLDKTMQEQGGLIYLTFTPSEFSLISLQGQHKNLDDNTTENLGFLKVTFNIGPHGQHPL